MNKFLRYAQDDTGILQLWAHLLAHMPERGNPIFVSEWRAMKTSGS